MTGAATTAPNPVVIDRAAAGRVRTVAAALAAVALGLLAGGVVLTVLATGFFDFSILTVSSGSMAPALDSGDLIVVRPVAIDAVDEGDIVLFASGGNGISTVHRVIGINSVEVQVRDAATGSVGSTTDYRLVTRGDANPAPDNAEVTAEMLRGEVWFSIPHAGALARRGIGVAFGIALGLLVAAWAAYEIAVRLKDANHAM